MGKPMISRWTKKYIVTFGLFGMFILGQVVFASKDARAVNVKAPYLLEQAHAKAPEVTAYLTGKKMSKKTAVSGMVGDFSLVPEKETETFKKSKEGMRYIILVDNSGSVNEKQFKEVKDQLIAFRKNLRKQDELLLYTVGTNLSTGKKKNAFGTGRVIKGSEKKAIKKDIKKIKAISYRNSAKSKTVLYRSLNEVIAANTVPKIRTVVLIITDGEDDSKGKDIDKVSTQKNVRESAVPVYGILLNNTAKKPNKKKMNDTRNKILNEKNCRGYYADCSNSGSTKAVKKAFKDLKDLWLNSTYVVSLKAETNQTLVSPKLSVVANSQSTNTLTIDYSDYVKDETPPVIVGGIKKISENAISLSFEDENGINQEDVNDQSHYIIQAKTEEGDGQILAIQNASSSADGHEITVTLTLSESFVNDDYVVKVRDIHDLSQDANAMSSEIEFTVEDGLSKQVVRRKEFVTSYWWIVLLAVVIILGIILIVLFKKRAVRVVEVDPTELNKADSKFVRLEITDRAGMIKDVEWKVEGSLFVGRSNICNIFFDDDRLSKQHFVIEVTKMGCYLEDLESTNGTFVNGVKVTGRRMLLDGDIITAGREKIVFHIPKNQPFDEEEA